MNAGLKAGLIGGAVVAVLQFAGLIPCVGCFTWLLALAVYVGVGALAAFWLPAPREAGPGAGAGAVAGVVSAIIGGIFGMIASGIQFAIADTAAIVSQMPEESLRALREAGVNPQIFTSLEFALAASGFCCVVVIFVAAVLGAIGGGIFAAVQEE